MLYGTSIFWSAFLLGNAAAPPPAKPLLPVWDFSKGNACGWHFNRAWREKPQAGQFWRIEADDNPDTRVPGGGMMLLGPELPKPADVVPGDGVEMVLRSSRTGWVTIYYADIVDGKKRDFGPECSERRLLYSSPDFQTFRVRPRWRNGAQVYRIRLDGPSFGGRLDIRSVGFFRSAVTAEKRADGAWDFREPAVAREVLGPHPPPNFRYSPDGIVIAGNDGPGILSLDTREIDADANPWLRIRMRVAAGPLGGFAFHPTNRGTDAKMRRYWAGSEFIKWFQFNVRTDNEFHTYNLRLSDYDYAHGKNPDRKNRKRTGFEGRQRVFHIVPSHNPQAGSCLQSVSFGPAPMGPACLVCEYAGAAEAVLRQGRPGVIAVRLRNAGGASVAGFGVERADDNATVKTDIAGIRGRVDSLAPDNTTTLYLDVTAAEFGEQRLTLRIFCHDDHLSVPITLDIAPRITLPQGAIPPPRPVRTKYHIGCYYFTGWSDLGHWPKIPPFAERRPALGYYNECTPEVADWDIKWAVEHGIDHFVVLWYHYNGKQRTRFIEDALLKAKFLPYIKFSVLWCNASNPWWKYSEQDFVNITDYWIHNYFTNKQYRCDEQGRPIAWMLQGWNMLRHFGKEDAVRLMRDADARARAAGFPGIHWIACQHGGKHLFDAPADLLELGFKEWSAYTISGLKTYPYPVVPAETVVDSAPVIWRHIPVKPVLPIFCGWDSRWVGRGFTACYGFTPELFRKHLEQARATLDGHSADSLVIDCWNEWGEGEILGPNADYGFRLLKQVADVFAPEESPRPVVVPEDVGVTVPQISGIWDRVDRPFFRRHSPR